MQAGGAHPGQGEGEEQQGHQQVEDPLQHPSGELGGHRDLFFASNQVGAHKLAGAAKQGDGGKADHGGGEQVAHGGMRLQRFEKDGPAQGSPPVGAENRDKRDRYPPPVDVGEGGGGQLPIEDGGAELPGAEQPDGQRGDEQKGGNPFPPRPMSPNWALNRDFSALRGREGTNPTPTGLAYRKN